MHVILVKGNRLHSHAALISQHLRHNLSGISANFRTHDPVALLANPDHMVTKLVDAVGGSDILHPRSIARPFSFIHG